MPPPAGDDGLAISVCDLTKTFRHRGEPLPTLRERVVRPHRRRMTTRHTHLAGVSFDVARGEFFGIVGKNGSGKSTLLRCLAGIYRPDRGRVTVNGRAAPFIELGGGFDQELPAIDNVVISGLMLGLSRSAARDCVDGVFAFAELEDARHVRLKNYSSGMLVRLAFSVLLAVDPDVLLLDEVLAVGDAGFREKCARRFDELQGDGRTIVLVTHDMDLLERHCDRALLIHDGHVLELGAPVDVAAAYAAVNGVQRA